MWKPQDMLHVVRLNTYFILTLCSLTQGWSVRVEMFFSLLSVAFLFICTTQCSVYSLEFFYFLCLRLLWRKLLKTCFLNYSLQFSEHQSMPIVMQRGLLVAFFFFLPHTVAFKYGNERTISCVGSRDIMD